MFVSRSGLGDGFYDLSVAKNEDGKVFAIDVNFIDDEKIDRFKKILKRQNEPQPLDIEFNFHKSFIAHGEVLNKLKRECVVYVEENSTTYVEELGSPRLRITTGSEAIADIKEYVDDFHRNGQMIVAIDDLGLGKGNFLIIHWGSSTAYIIMDAILRLRLELPDYETIMVMELSRDFHRFIREICIRAYELDF